MRSIQYWYMAFVSRAGAKLDHALNSFEIDVAGKICADFGSSTGGFVDCLLQRGTEQVYAVEVGYGTLDWKLRRDPRVVVLERTNAMHVELPEKMDFITIDAGWTKQKLILPNALKNLKVGGTIVSLIKPHYEAEQKYIHKGKLIEDKIPEVIAQVKKDIADIGAIMLDIVESPIEGEKGKNKEYLALIKAQ